MKVMCVCDHVYPVIEKQVLHCPSCGSAQIQRTVGVGAPRIVGCASGPFVETKALEAIAVDLTIKEPVHG